MSDRIILHDTWTWRDDLYLFWNFKLPMRLYKLRGLRPCRFHGYRAQSWWTGKCKQCARWKSMRIYLKGKYIIETEDFERVMRIMNYRLSPKMKGRTYFTIRYDPEDMKIIKVKQ